MIDFPAIKARHPLEDVLTRRGVPLRRVPGGWTAKCPIHGEQNGASFSVNERKQVWFCHGRCATGGDVFTLVQHLDGAETAQAAAEILEGRPLTEQERQAPRTPAVVQERIVRERELPRPPQFWKGKEDHHRRVAAARGLHYSAISTAQAEGCLRYCLASWRAEEPGFPAYAVLDVQNPCNIQVRRLETDAAGKGLPFPWGPKVMGIRGNWASWPVGLTAAARHPDSLLLLVEGTGDFLAGWDIRARIHDVLPIAMFGASQLIHEGALPCFTGRDILIIEQHDAAGALAADRWQAQLAPLQPRSLRRWKAPHEGHDLNDHLATGGTADEVLSNL